MFEARCLQTVSQTGSLFFKFGADDNAGSLTGAYKINHLISCTFRIDRNTGGAGAQHTEVSHSPLWRVVAEKHYSVAALNVLVSEESGRAQRQFPKISVGVLLFTTIAFDTHGDSSCMSLGGRFKHFDQIA